LLGRWRPWNNFFTEVTHLSLLNLCPQREEPGRLYIGRRNASDFADRRVMRGLVSNFLHYQVSGSQSQLNIARCHRIDTGPEGTLLCVLAEGKRPNFFYVQWRHPGVHTELCTYVFLWKTSVCTLGWRHMMAYFHVSTRKISRKKISSEWHFWLSIYSVSMS
jgi:hypothetical protein